MSTSFVPMTVRPSESCKPLDARFGQESSLYPEMASTTSYGDHFLPKPLPLKEQCPAELLLGLGSYSVCWTVHVLAFQ